MNRTVIVVNLMNHARRSNINAAMENALLSIGFVMARMIVMTEILVLMKEIANIIVQ